VKISGYIANVKDATETCNNDHESYLPRGTLRAPDDRHFRFSSIKEREDSLVEMDADGDASTALGQCSQELLTFRIFFISRIFVVVGALLVNEKVEAPRGDGVIGCVVLYNEFIDD
jgi:hypothetical protein